MQADPTQPPSNAPGTKCLNLKYNKLLSNSAPPADSAWNKCLNLTNNKLLSFFALSFNLRRYE